MGGVRNQELADTITEQLARRYSTALVLFHHAVGESMGLGPTDHKCLELLRERGAMTGSELAAATGLTTGAITGVVARLEAGGFLRRKPHPEDGRKQILQPVMQRIDDIHAIIGPFRRDVSAALGEFDRDQLAAVASFLDKAATLAFRHAALMRAQSSLGVSANDSERVV